MTSSPSRVMDPRILGMAGALIPTVVALSSSAAAAQVTLLAAVAALAGAVATVLLRRAVFLAALGAALGVLATVLAADARNLLDVTASVEAAGWPTIDLTEGAMPETTPDFVEVRGFFRTGWVLDEYAVAEGDLPDQDRDPEAVLVPITGKLEGVVELSGPVVVARVRPGQQEAAGLQTLRGKVKPLDRELLGTLVSVSNQVPPDRVRGVLLDTTAVPARRDGLVTGGLAILCLLISLAGFWFSRPPARPPAS